MNCDEAKTILLLYRPGTTDAEDAQTAEALALARSDPALARWLEDHCARQLALRDQFRNIAPPAGLKEQILSEHAALRKMAVRRKIALTAVAALALLVAVAVPARLLHHRTDNTLAVYQERMADIALRGYAMDLQTNSPEQIRAYLAQNHAPADFVLPAQLTKQAALAGCAVQSWRKEKVSMICFRSGRPLAPGGKSDLWLFVVARSSVKGLPTGDSQRLTRVDQLITATWTQGDTLYLLETEGDEQTIRQYL